MMTQSRRCRQLVRPVAVLAMIAGSSVLFTGCATASKRSDTSAATKECQCAHCAAPLMSSGEAVLPDQPLLQPDSGLQEYNHAQAAADSAPWSYALPPQPIPPDSEPELPAITMPREPSCDSQARQECAELQEQTEALREQLERMESHLANERSRQLGLSQSLAAVNSKVRSLSGELDYWKEQVQRIDEEAEQQHRADLESLQTISELISRLPRPTTAAEESPRQ